MNDTPRDACSPTLLGGEPTHHLSAHPTAPRGGLSPSGRLNRRDFPTEVGFERAVAHRGAFDHFALRVAERLPAGTSAARLWDGLIRAIEADATRYVRFVCAAQTKHRQIYRFHLLDQSTHFLVWHHRKRIPITVLEPGFQAKRRNPRKRVFLDHE